MCGAGLRADANSIPVIGLLGYWHFCSNDIDACGFSCLLYRRVSFEDSMDKSQKEILRLQPIKNGRMEVYVYNDKNKHETTYSVEVG